MTNNIIKNWIDCGRFKVENYMRGYCLSTIGDQLAVPAFTVVVWHKLQKAYYCWCHCCFL